MSELSHIIQAEITASGPLSFARFMELALYHPGLGYYETGRNRVGFQGDFYTSVSTGELFGQLLAFRFARWLEALPVTSQPGWLIEAGAHDGRLAQDILTWLRGQRPELFARVRYGIVDPSRERQEWQREKLGEFGGQVQWFDRLAAITPTSPAAPLPSPAAPRGGIHGVIFSNELLDALPVHRLGWDASRQAWFEWGVGWEDHQFAWTKIATDRQRVLPAPDLPAELLAVLPDGYTVEVTPAAGQWWREAAGILRQGKLLAIDYGFTQEEMINPARTNGTLRGYHQHQYSENVLAQPGEQDLTAHVNFSAIRAAGESAGLQTDAYLTQPQFLTGILGEAVKDPSFGEWTTRRTRQFQTLTHPQHLGRSFKVLVQSRTGSP